ncbi:MAG: DUF882 domain-containing protein, partial [Deltaproteobacteria bacterium]|nr:DUF882 domain-containing protein [Deltaproteobacteria bacterium]
MLFFKRCKIPLTIYSPNVLKQSMISAAVFNLYLTFSLQQDQISAEFLWPFRCKEQFPFRSCSYTVLQAQVPFRLPLGVGDYPCSNFVHIDVGPIRYWQYPG